MKILITGAHFTPAQAVIEELLRSKEKVEIVYVGRKSTREGDSTPSVESQILPKMGVKFIPIIAGRIRRYISIGTFTSLLKIPIGFVQAFLILLKESPDIVVSFGGYVAVPLVFNAWLLNIPIIVHEQTLVSGLSNSFSNYFASRIAVAFDVPYAFNQTKLLLTGNPMRKKILEPVEKGSSPIEEIIRKAKKEKKPLILITGGNQGSHIINEVIEESLVELVKNYFVVHQTGDSQYKDFERLEIKAQDSAIKGRYHPSKWLSEEDMGRLFQSVDLAISRCGANTLLELSYHQVPTLMIPLPTVTKDEQTKNARYFAEHGLGKVLLQKDLNTKSLLTLIQEVSEDPYLKTKIKDINQVVILGAEKKLAHEILLIPYKA